MHRSLLAGLTGAILALAAIPADAQQAQITPSHVVQAADNVAGELQLLLDANFSDPAMPAPRTFTNKRPRHVIQKARAILLKVQLLEQINGLPVKDSAPIEVREIRPADVIGWVEQVLAAVRELRGPYRITATPALAPLGEKLTPNDAYQRLVQVEEMVDRLDLPATVPNDVFRLAMSLVEDARLLARAVGMDLGDELGVEWKLPDPKRNRPVDVYVATYTLLEQLKALSEKTASLAVPGGIHLPAKKSGAVTPGDVIDILNTVMAELSSMKNLVKVTEPSKVFPPQSAKTPADSLVVIEAASEFLTMASNAVQSAN